MTETVAASPAKTATDFFGGDIARQPRRPAAVFAAIVRACALILPFASLIFHDFKISSRPEAPQDVLWPLWPLAFFGYTAVSLLLVKLEPHADLKRLAGVGAKALFACVLLASAFFVQIVVSPPLSILPFTLIVLVGASTLDRGSSQALFLIVLGIILPFSLEPLSPFGFRLPGELQWLPTPMLSIIAITATLPIFLHLRRQRKARTEADGVPAAFPSAKARLTLVALLVIIASCATYLSVWSVVREVPRILSVNEGGRRIESLKVIGLELEKEFSPDQISGNNPRLSAFLTRSAALAQQNVYIFKKSPGKPSASKPGADYRIVAGAKRRTNYEESRPTVAFVPVPQHKDMSPAELRAIFSFRYVPQGAAPDEPLLDANGGPSQVTSLYDPRAAARPQEGSAKQGFVVPDRFGWNPASSFVIAATSPEPNWWLVAPLPVLNAMAPIFPWLFFGVLFAASTFLLPAPKRRKETSNS